MRNLNLEATVWYLFASPDFFEEGAKECDATLEWFGTLAVSRNVANFGRNNQLFDKIKNIASDFRRGADLARLGDYKLAWDTALCVPGDVRGMLEQPLRSWMCDDEYNEFFDVKIHRVAVYARQISKALQNALWGAQIFYYPDPDYPDLRNDDGGFPGKEIAEVYQRSANWFKEPIFRALPDPLPNYVIDRSVQCQTGDEVPWTGVWCPSAGLEKRSLTFAVKGLRMQPAYRIIKTTDERNAEGGFFTTPETVAEEAAWHPLIASGYEIKNEALWAKAGEACPKAGVWQPADVNAHERALKAGESMPDLGSAYGLTVWHWLRDR